MILSVATNGDDECNIKYVPGVLGTAFQFDGSSSIECGNVIDSLGMRRISFFKSIFWMKTTHGFGLPGQYGIPILGQRPYCDATDCFQFRLMKSGSAQNYILAELGDHRNQLNPLVNYGHGGQHADQFSRE